MRQIKRLLVFVLLLCVLLFGVLFSVQNTETVTLDLLFVQLPMQRVALWVLLAFALGGVVGMVISVSAILSLKSRNLLLQRKLLKTQKELAALRAPDFDANKSQ